MTPRPRTIQIFLPGGDPRGLRMAEITTSIVRVFEIPRSLLVEFLSQPSADQVGLYFLLGPGEGDTLPSLYVGQSGNVGTRLAQHHRGMEFWDRALAVVSLTNNLTQTHAGYLEWLAIREAASAGRWRLENSTAGSRPHTPPPLEADCQEIFDVARTLVATLGHPLFEPLVVRGAKARIYVCRASGADARGEYTPEGFVVLKGSRGRIENVASIRGTPLERMRLGLVDEGVLVAEGEHYRFERDRAFPSPSAAASAVMGRTANGWVEWKTEDGRTLDEIERGSLPGESI
jgi:hypothetical protein